MDLGQLGNKNAMKHGGYKERLYISWRSMKLRCSGHSDEQHRRQYYERGIKVCQEWENDYSVFRDWAMKNGYKEGLTIDRIDVNGDYTPENCRWATSKEQANNKRDVRMITFNGETHSMPEWADIVGIPYQTIFWRIVKQKWEVDKALTQKVRKAKLITYNGKTKTIEDWAKDFGIDKTTIYSRMRLQGMSGEEAIKKGAGRKKSLEVVDALEDTERGENGFGSTGR